MNQLTTADIERITSPLQLIARPLDWMLWQVTQGEVSWGDVVPLLSAYQNPDGGFGHGIEPDVWHPASSPLATTVALQYVQAAGIPMDHALVQHALTYLATSYDRSAGKWHPMSAGVNDYPHAPWWHANEQTGQNALDGDWPNPTVEIIGYLRHYRGTGVDVSALYDAVVAYICTAQTMESHSLACYMRAYEWLPAAVQVVIYPHVVRLLQSTIHPDANEWLTAYVPTPLDYVQTPASPFFVEIAQLVEIQLDQWCHHVQTTGVWSPTWQWGQYVDAWPTAQAWWSGKMTVERLMILGRFGRIT